MKTSRTLIFIIFTIIVLTFIFVWPKFRTSVATPKANLSKWATTPTTSSETIKPSPNAVKSESGFVPPLDQSGDRVTKKPFGIYITPENSPIRPERFQGFHTGSDFETFPDEQNVDVPVRAVCNGTLLAKESASGYGGVAVQSCVLGSASITVIYGHLKLTSINFSVGDKLKSDDILGILGKAYSSETDGERKHLHLGFHKSSAVNILGYVSSSDQLSGWLDPCQTVCQD